MTENAIRPIIQEFEQGERTFLSKTWYQVWKTTGETTHGVVDTWFEVVPPQMGPPKHKHAQFDECFWIVKGTFLIKAAGNTMKVSEGAWIFVPRGTAHCNCPVFVKGVSWEERLQKGEQHLCKTGIQRTQKNLK